jgi:hypothetical protein
MRRLRTFPLEDLLLAQAVPGFVLAIAWTVMYEIYNEDGSYYTTLMQEILASGDLLPYFLVGAGLIAFPVGMVVDTLRHVLGEVWLGLPHLRRGQRAPASPLHWIEGLATLPEDFERRYLLYRHAWVSLLTPAKAAGNLAVVLLVLTIWFVVKIVQMRGWHVFSPAFILGTPVAGLGLVLALAARYSAGMGEFHRRVQESIFPPKGTPVFLPGEDVPPSPS